MKTKISIFWFRRDLRLEDNVGLCQALTSGYPILPIFIFDETILSHIENKKDRRVDYIHQALSKINVELKTHQSTLFTFYGKPLDIFKILLEKYDIQGVFCNRDYEPKAIKRDTEIYQFFKRKIFHSKHLKTKLFLIKTKYLKMMERLTLFTLRIPKNGKKN